MSKLVRVYLCPPPSSVPKNGVGDRRVISRPENLEMNLILKYEI